MRPSPPTYTIPSAGGMCLHPYGRESNGAMFIPWMYCLTYDLTQPETFSFSSDYLKHLFCLKPIIVIN